MRYAILFLLLTGCGGTVAHDLPRDVPKEPCGRCDGFEAVNKELFLHCSSEKQIADEMLKRLGAPIECKIRACGGPTTDFLAADQDPIPAKILSQKPYHFATREIVGLNLRCNIERPGETWPDNVHVLITLPGEWRLSNSMTAEMWPSGTHFFDRDANTYGVFFFKDMLAKPHLWDGREFEPEHMTFSILLVRKADDK